LFWKIRNLIHTAPLRTRNFFVTIIDITKFTRDQTPSLILFESLFVSDRSVNARPGRRHLPPRARQNSPTRARRNGTFAPASCARQRNEGELFWDRRPDSNASSFAQRRGESIASNRRGAQNTTAAITRGHSRSQAFFMVQREAR
jgi:hypothetical protein